MYNILPQVKALGKKQKLCLYQASAIFTEIKFLCPPWRTCTSYYCHRELCMLTGGGIHAEALNGMRVGNTEVVWFHGPLLQREQALGLPETGSDQEQVEMSESCA